MLPDNISVLKCALYLFIYLYNQNTSIDFVKRTQTVRNLVFSHTPFPQF